MSRYKGQITSKQIQRDWPEQVEFAPAPGSYGGGFGRVLEDMDKFCRGMDCQTDTVRDREGNFLSRWCFKIAADADAFHAAFGGRRITVLPPRRRARAGGARNWKPGWQR